MVRLINDRLKHSGAETGLLLVALLLLIGSTLSHAQTWTYPPAREGDVVEVYHGTEVADPYRWLEDGDSEETRLWVEAENQLTFSYLEKYPGREQIKERLTELWNYPRYSTPRRAGKYYFYSKNDGLQNQSVLYMQTDLAGASKVVIDPNKLSEDGTVALTNQSSSHDGKLLAYGLSTSGSDWQEIRIRDVDNGRDYDDVIKWCKFTGIAWKHDNSGFYYSRFPEPGTVSAEDQNNFQKVYWHKLGTAQSEDLLVYERPDEKEWGFFPSISYDGKYLVLYVYHGTDPRNRIYYREVQSDGPFAKLLDDADANYTPVGNVGTTVYFRTNLDAPKARIIAIDLDKPERVHWQEILPEADDVLSFVTIVNGQLVAAYMHDAHHRLKLFNLDGSFVKDLPLPAIGSVFGLSGKPDDSEMFMAFSSFLFPTSIYRYDFANGEFDLFKKAEINFDASGFETRQVFYQSKDGTRVPMFIIHRKGITLDGSNPTWLYGYGGFNVSLTPSFSSSRLVWLENGGVFAIANLRGGSEYGEEWHQAGTLERKQNVFDDFIAAAEWLIDNKYTAPNRLAINGGSNGGLLVAACMLQRPELYGAVVCQVPVIDMLRYHKFTVGRYWVSDYGNAEKDQKHFEFLYTYSPLHNVKKGATYPPTLVTTADTDDRVVPSHAKKFVATLQAMDSRKNPLLIRVETKAGHGGGKPTSKVIEELTDIYSFLFQTFNIDVSSPSSD